MSRREIRAGASLLRVWHGKGLKNGAWPCSLVFLAWMQDCRTCTVAVCIANSKGFGICSEQWFIGIKFLAFKAP